LSLFPRGVRVVVGLRRTQVKLTEGPGDYLDRWGYPYVMEEFRFHMTLTGRLDSARREPVMAMLRERFAAIGPKTFAIDRIALFREAHAGARFRIVRHDVLSPTQG